MESTPPPLQPIRTVTSFHHKAAAYGVLAIPAGILLNIVLGGVAHAAAESGSPVLRAAASLVPGLVMLSALPAGIFALCGIPKYGKRQLLWKGLVAVIVPILLIALAIPAFLKVKRMQEERARQYQESR